jgi:anti-sigma regulatory factor (Ser/Thr protein kinase)
MTDEITLRLPRSRDFYEIAHLVLGGLAVRLDLTLEHLDDLELALDGVLERHDGDGSVTVTLRVEGDAIHTVVGPFPGTRLRDELERDQGEHLGLRRLLDTVCDGVSVEERDDAVWIELTKSVRAAA